jgi:hypothetical protein
MKMNMNTKMKMRIWRWRWSFVRVNVIESKRIHIWLWVKWRSEMKDTKEEYRVGVIVQSDSNTRKNERSFCANIWNFAKRYYFLKFKK